MRLKFFIGTDRATREAMLEAEAAKYKVAPLDISRHRMTTREEMSAGIQALARGPFTGALRIVIWRDAGKVSNISPNWPEHTLLEAIAKQPLENVLLLAEGKSVGFPPTAGWSEISDAAEVVSSDEAPWYEPWDGDARKEQVSRIARMLDVDLDATAVVAVLRAAGADSVAIKDVLQRAALLAAGETVTGSFVRSVTDAVATTPQELVVEAIAGRSAEVARLGAALLAAGVKTMDLLIAAQRYGTQHLAIATTHNGPTQRLCSALRMRSGQLWYRRREAPPAQADNAAAVLDLALRGIKKELEAPTPPALIVQQLLQVARR